MMKFLVLILLALIPACIKDERRDRFYEQTWICMPDKCQVDYFSLQNVIRDLTDSEMCHVLDTAGYMKWVKPVKDTIIFMNHLHRDTLYYMVHVDSVLVKSEITKQGYAICP